MTVRADPVPRTNKPATPVEPGGEATGSFRDRRLGRLAEGRRRRELLGAADPSADPQFLNAIAAADLIGSGARTTQWRDALHVPQTAKATAQGRPRPQIAQVHRAAAGHLPAAGAWTTMS